MSAGVDRHRVGKLRVGRLTVERLKVYRRKVERQRIVRCGKKGRRSDVSSKVFIEARGVADSARLRRLRVLAGTRDGIAVGEADLRRRCVAPYQYLVQSLVQPTQSPVKLPFSSVTSTSPQPP